MKLLLYCTKAKPYLNCDYGKDNHEEYSGDWNIYLANKQDECSNIVNGKIVAECDYEVEEIGQHRQFLGCGYDLFFETDTLEDLELQKKSCLDTQQLANYFNSNADYGEKVGYAIHIKNLNVFDKPRELNECWANTNAWIFDNEKLDIAPQNMRYCGD